MNRFTTLLHIKNWGFGNWSISLLIKWDFDLKRIWSKINRKIWFKKRRISLKYIFHPILLFFFKKAEFDKKNGESNLKYKFNLSSK